MPEFKSIGSESLNENVFKIIGSEGFLLTAGDKNRYNTMTAGWGGFGILWNKSVCTVYVRKSRYTFEFIERFDHFTLSFFSEKYKGVLEFCGNNSGRNVDKISQSGLTPIFGEDGLVYYCEAKLVIKCRKIYFQDLEPENIKDKKVLKEFYPTGDYHRIYIGEIIQCLSHL